MDDDFLRRFKFLCIDSPWGDGVNENLSVDEIIAYLSENPPWRGTKEVRGLGFFIPEVLIRALENARKDQNLEGAAVYSFLLGFEVAKHAYPPFQEIAKLQSEIATRKAPLEKHNLRKKILKLLARRCAEIQWQKDIEQKLKVVDVCNNVYAQLYELLQAEADTDQFLKLLPERPDGLRPWLSKYAPPYARAKGRPKGN